MKIKIAHNIPLAIGKCTKITNNFEARIKMAIEDVAKLGVDIARTTFHNAIYDGTNDVVVENVKWVSNNKLEIVARGKAVAFIEFGTGIVYSEAHPLADELGMHRGQFGQKQGSHKSWTYYGEAGTHGKIVRVDATKGNVVLTKGNPPAMAMYKAGQKIRNEILKTIREALI